MMNCFCLNHASGILREVLFRSLQEKGKQQLERGTSYDGCSVLS